MKSVGCFAACFLAAALAVSPLAARDPATAPTTQAPPARIEPVRAKHGMVVGQEKRAVQVGRDVLEKGGNAVDAAVAVAFALAVTLPKAGNLGGGGFMLVYLADRNKTIAIDYRETAPSATTPGIFLDEKGEADPTKSRDSGLAVGVPGTVAGLTLALARFGSGKFTLSELIEPAIRFARDGVPVDDDLLDSLRLAQPRLARWPSAARIFLKPDGSAPSAGDRLVQADLATTLETIAREGPRAFYRGPMADEIVDAVRMAGGSMRRGDIQDYGPVIRKPVFGSYRDYEIASMPPPSSGGVHLIEMLNILEDFPLRDFGAGSPAALHLMIEAMKLAYADRAAFLGDTDSVDVPVDQLMSKSYAAALRAGINARRARPAHEIRGEIASPGEGRNTTHFSIADRDGNVVANTTTLNFNYGLGLVAGSTGILLNNTLDDFAAKPGVPNAFGLLGGAANAPAPGKRPLSSMTPTIVFKDGRPVLVTGAPGGSRIISTVLQVVVNTIDFGKSVAEAVALPRVHHQWMPDEVTVERTLPTDTIRALTARGHKVRVGPAAGAANSIAITPEGLVGAADTRARGAAAAGY